MAAPARKANDQTATHASMPSISSAGDASLTKALADYTPDYEFEPHEPFTLKGRFRFRQEMPLPDFGTARTKAFAVQDANNPSAQLYGVLLQRGLQPRTKTIQSFEKMAHPNLIKLHASGVVLWGTERRMALVFDRPQGKTLASIMEAQGRPLPESFVIEHIIRPLTEVLILLASQGITHGRISLSNIYFSDKVELGEGISEPCGASQPPLYEPPERLFTEPLGKGKGTPAVDIYALGVTILLLLRGNSPLSGVDRQTLLDKLLAGNAYTVLTRNHEPPALMQDLLRGMLADELRDRWTAEYVRAWSHGQRTPSTAMLNMPDAQRPFVFLGQEYFTCRTLADALNRNPEAAIAELKETRLLRWVEHSKQAHRADALERVVRAVTMDTAGRESIALLARAIAILDPAGPIRMSGFACHPTALGIMLADAYARQDAQVITSLLNIIGADIMAVWKEMQPDQEDNEVQDMVGYLQKTRLAARMTGLGGGVERVLYDLNPNLPCMSPLIAAYYATTPADLLLSLDSAAKGAAANSPPIDRHIAAWLASRLEIAKDIRVPGFDTTPALRNHPILIAVMLFEAHLRKISNLKMPGLACWMTQFLLPLLPNFKSQKLRERLGSKLLSLAKQGSVLGIAAEIVTSRPMESDADRFYDAQLRYAACTQRIAWLNHPQVIALESVRIGYSVARVVAWIIIMSVTYITVTQQLPW